MQMPCLAEATMGAASASARVTLRVIVPPVFRILQVTPLPGARAYRVWTNMASVSLQGRLYRFEHVGETTLVVPHSANALFITPDI